MPIDYENELNPAQWEAVRTTEGPLLCIAGAGSGKTRTIVYKLAYLVENGVRPESILLLTFTRKASQEMQIRAGQLLGQSNSSEYGYNPAGALGGVQGGTFHSFAYRMLRMNPPSQFDNSFTIMDRQDAETALKDVKASLGLGKGDRSFPKIGTVLEILGKSRNKETTIEDVLSREAFHLGTYAEDFQKMHTNYGSFKLKHGLMDYDDLLFKLEELLHEREDLRNYFKQRISNIMIDEYQDTNLVQARLVHLLAPESGRVMAVGDDAQSIYAFRGANVQNIMDFPKVFPGTKIVKLEQNYRSVQTILDLTNNILAQSATQYKKNLFSDRASTKLPHLIRPQSDFSQAKIVVNKVVELLKDYPPEEIAVLFRAGYQSYHIETGLSKLGIQFRKYGGLRFSDAAHVKDVLAYVRLVLNPGDPLAWKRAVGHIRGIGPKTADKLLDAVLGGDEKKLTTSFKKWPALKELLDTLHKLRKQQLSPAALMELVMDFYQPVLELAYPDDYPRRQKGLEELHQITKSYKDVEQLLADLTLENPDQEERENTVTLSTIHQAKGLEWCAVLVIDLVEERFPSRHALNNADDFEEERRLMYVACTRAKDYLGLLSPRTLYKRGQDYSETAVLSPFIREISQDYFEEYSEDFTGGLKQKGAAVPAPKMNFALPPRVESSKPKSLDGANIAPPSAPKPPKNTGPLGYCKHKIFGRGKVVTAIPPNKYRVNFPGFGLKVIIADFLEME